jgi:nucleotidyltransferase/DNA polymerase involved in DNA repair
MTATKSRIADLPNLGPKSQAMLERAGIKSLAQLRKLGAAPAYVLAKRADNSASVNLLYALAGCIHGQDWRVVRRERRLELLNAVEAYERRHPTKRALDELSQLRNIGKAMRKDFELLGIKSVKQLARCNADKLYAQIQTLTGSRHDPCVWDTYAAAIHQAKTGEALPWWDFTTIRKERELFIPLSPKSRRVRRALGSARKPLAGSR